MNPTIQPETHPDADNLVAFAEQSLPAVERDQIFAHMSTCSRCREIVFLAQRALEDEQMESASVSPEVPGRRRISWFRGWHWVWLPAGALTMFMGIAVIQHTRHAATETQMSARGSQTPALSNLETSTVSSTPLPPSSASKQAPSAKSSEERDDALSRAHKDAGRQLDQKKSVERKESASRIASLPVPVSPGVAAESLHGMMGARARSSSPGGPLATNQLEQQNMALQQNAFQQTQNAAQDAENNPVRAKAAITAATESVAVQPQSAPVPSTMQVQPANSTVILDNLKTSPVYEERLHKAADLALPKGHQTLSTVSMADRAIALDTTGALFLSEDAGKHWKSIPAQWTGRAVLVRTRPIEPKPSTLAGVQTMRFELVNDKLQTWLSIDGKIWTPQPLPLK